jgi:hypothetical protein
MSGRGDPARATSRGSPARLMPCPLKALRMPPGSPWYGRLVAIDGDWIPAVLSSASSARAGSVARPAHEPKERRQGPAAAAMAGQGAAVVLGRASERPEHAASWTVLPSHGTAARRKTASPLTGLWCLWLSRNDGGAFRIAPEGAREGARAASAPQGLFASERHLFTSGAGVEWVPVDKVTLIAEVFGFAPSKRGPRTPLVRLPMRSSAVLGFIPMRPDVRRLGDGSCSRQHSRMGRLLHSSFVTRPAGDAVGAAARVQSRCFRMDADPNWTPSLKSTSWRSKFVRSSENGSPTARPATCTFHVAAANQSCGSLT